MFVLRTLSDLARRCMFQLGTMNTRKKFLLCLLHALDEDEALNPSMVRGTIVQTIRWLILDLEATISLIEQFHPFLSCL